MATHLNYWMVYNGTQNMPPSPLKEKKPQAYQPKYHNTPPVPFKTVIHAPKRFSVIQMKIHL